MLSGVLMLVHLGERDAADRLEAGDRERYPKGREGDYDLQPTQTDPPPSALAVRDAGSRR